MKKLVLRDYQKKCVDKLLWAHALTGSDIAVLPTGAGKSIIIAELAHKLNQPILILQPSKEILEQNYNKLCHYVDESEIGIYSASMKQKELGFYTFATIQSIYRKPELFTQFRTVIIDECHLVDPKNLSGMYTSFLESIGNPKVIGMTATPYRMSLMYRQNEALGLEAITTIKLINRMKGRFWQRIVFVIDHVELVAQGHLVPLRYIDKSVVRHNEIPLNASHSEFDLQAFERKILDKREEIIHALTFAQALSTSVLVFCSSVEQANDLAEEMHGSVVTAETKKRQREQIIEDFKMGKSKMVFNVGCLTTGFDHPSLGVIVLLRPTRSLGLYTQMLGRGCRNSPGKRFCRVIDLTGNVSGMGRIETIRIVKKEKWEIESESGSWHNRPLDSFMLAPRKEFYEEK